MKRVLFLILALVLLTVPVLAVDEEPAPEPEELPEATEYTFSEFEVLQEPDGSAGEELSDELYAELAQLRVNTDYIFLGVIALSGVVLGCFVGVTMIRLWGA